MRSAALLSGAYILGVLGLGFFVSGNFVVGFAAYFAWLPAIVCLGVLLIAHMIFCLKQTIRLQFLWFGLVPAVASWAFVVMRGGSLLGAMQLGVSCILLFAVVQFFVTVFKELLSVMFKFRRHEAN